MLLLKRPLQKISLVTFLVAGAAAISACGFSPVYAPDGTANALHNQISIQAPQQVSSRDETNAYFLVRDLEERLGRNASGAYALDLALSTHEEGQAITADNEITRYSVIGEASYSLVRQSDGVVVSSGTETNFTGYSATGSTVETLAGERDAYERLMLILADQITARILTTADIATAAAE